MKQKKKLISSLELFILFLSLVIIGNAYLLKNISLLILLIPLVITLFFNRTNWKFIILMIIIICIYLIIHIYIKNIISFKQMNNYIDKQNLNFYYLRNLAINHIQNVSINKYTASYINLLLFNYKNEYSHEIYNLIKQLSISHLFVVSGLHINLLTLIIHKTIFFKVKNKYVLLGFDFLVCSVFSYFLAFSISVVRILLNSIIALITKIENKLHLNYYSSIFIMFFFKNEVTNFGYLMSYFCVIGILHIIEFTPNKLLITCLTNLYCTIVTLPFIAIMNNKINIYTFFFNYLYSSIVLIQYLWFIFFGWFSFMVGINNFIVVEILKLIQINVELSVFMSLKWMNKPIITGYFLILTTLFSVFFQAKLKNKMDYCGI